MVKTVRVKVDPENPPREVIEEAARVIRSGGLVAFPTETVYGLGADALNPDAVMRVFRVKGRPPDNPLIVHVADPESIYLLASEVPRVADLLIERFWPGPLTLVLKRTEVVPPVTSAGLDTVAVRMPDHRVPLELIRSAGTPIAAPSANKSGSPSPTTADHVMMDLEGVVELVLDGGPTEIGVESTVLDVTVYPPEVLRPGGLSVEEIERVVGRVRVPGWARGLEKYTSRPRSPGMKYRHYAPKARLILVEGSPQAVYSKVQELVKELYGTGTKVGVLTTDGKRYENATTVDLGPSRDLRTVAKSLFCSIRALDESGVDVIIAESVEEKGIGLAIMNRLRKASGGEIVSV
ncbi:MAG: L-threonylcarbamoyladenylate synthase [Thaumarchaeota archaeon]|nr:L-threonylcarbamoyladenylate synthase [Candidatus Calditenuaceae archaeon]MDW8186608.1 L-threonylcarbamoyladenylate synthase [Nitrososphaerota archaeon]